MESDDESSVSNCSLIKIQILQPEPLFFRLMPLMTQSPAIQSMRESSKVVRDFVEEKIIEPKRRNRIDSFSNDSNDFLDNMMNYIDSQKTTIQRNSGDDFDNVDMDRQSALYALVGTPTTMSSMTSS